MNSATLNLLERSAQYTHLMSRRACSAALIATFAIVSFSLRPGAAGPPVTVDDLMKLRSINEVRISPAGDRVAYVASVPALPKSEHEPAPFVVPVSGGAPARLGESIRIFNLPSPRAQLR